MSKHEIYDTLQLGVKRADKNNSKGTGCQFPPSLASVFGRELLLQIYIELTARNMDLFIQWVWKYANYFLPFYCEMNSITHSLECIETNL